MKKQSFIALVLLLVAGSCEQYLTKNPISNYNTGNFYKTQTDFELAINGVYVNLRGVVYNKAILMESRSDNTKVRQIGSENQLFALLSTFAETPATAGIIGYWTHYWSIINQSNLILEKIDDAAFDTEHLRNQIKGEAYFLRGFAYFELGWLWGGVPIVQKQATPQELAAIRRSTQTETLQFAEDNFLKAVELLPEKWEAKYLGKATRYAAKGYLARLYMFRSEFAKAEPHLADIVSSGYYGLFDTFAGAFDEVNDNGKEHLFQVQYQSGVGGHGLGVPLNMFGQYRHENFPNGAGPGLFVSTDLFDVFESGDTRRDYSIVKNLYTLSGVFNSTDMMPIKFAHGLNQNNFFTYGLNFPLLRYSDVLLMYAEVLNETDQQGNENIGKGINLVRARGSLSPVSVTGLSKVEIRKIIMHERRVELAFEGLRWFDLLRTKTAKDVMGKFLTSPENASLNVQMGEYRTLLPIPQEEININPNRDYMWQNPGYN